MKKIGFAISGGGAKWGFPTGVLKVMKKKIINPAVVCGISSGSLCTAGYLQGGVDLLEEEFLKVRSIGEVLSKQFYSVARTLLLGIGGSDGLYSMDPARRWLEKIVTDEPYMYLRKGIVGYVEFQSGSMNYVTTKDPGIDRKKWLDAVQSSCCIPIAMQSVIVGNEIRFDGGVRDVMPLRRLLDEGCDEIHAIVLSPAGNDPAIKWKYSPRIHSVAERTADIMTHEIMISDIKIADLYNRLLKYEPIPGKKEVKIYFYQPKEVICDGLDFCQANTKRGIQMGMETAEEVLKDYQFGGNDE